MPAFLHRPAPEARITALVRPPGKREDQRLDFKTVFWRGTPEWVAKEEAGKDVAAMANADGGDILVGIKTEKVEGADVAVGFDDAPDVRTADGGDRGVQLKDWIRGRITPREMVETVESGLLQVPDESAQRPDVLVVSVPAWPHGPVAALRGERQDVGGKGPAYFFPVRCGEHTRCLTFEEIMRLTEGLRRSIRLRLLELKNQQQGFYFASRASICLQNVLDVPLPVNGGDQGFHGTITSVDVDAITLEVAGARVSGRWQDGSGVSHLLEATVPDGKRLVVPLEFVRAAWRDPEPAAWVGLALDVDVVWRGNRWNLDLGGGAR